MVKINTYKIFLKNGKHDFILGSNRKKALQQYLYHGGGDLNDILGICLIKRKGKQRIFKISSPKPFKSIQPIVVGLKVSNKSFPNGLWVTVTNEKYKNRVNDNQIYFYLEDNVKLNKLRRGQKIELDESYLIEDIKFYR
jgi:hypothetical protein